MGMLGRLFRLGSATANEAMDGLESGKEVELTKGDLRELKKDENKVLEALAEIKSSVVGLRRDIKAAQTRQTSYENNAMALLEKDAEDSQGLAAQNASQAEQEEAEVTTLQDQLTQQTQLENETRENLRTIQTATSSANNDLRLMSSMSAASKSAEKARAGLSGVGKSNALSRIQERKAKLQGGLDKQRALSELAKEGSPTALADATKSALGGGANSKLAALKAKMAEKKGTTIEA